MNITKRSHFYNRLDRILAGSKFGVAGRPARKGMADYRHAWANAFSNSDLKPMKKPAALHRLVVTIALASLICTQAIGAEITMVQRPDAILPWFNGLISNVGTDTACLSDPPFSEIRVQGYAGYTLVPPNRTPAVGEVFYSHLVLSHPGNPCTGSAVSIELMLPTGVQMAASSSDPAFCFARVPATAQRPYPLLINLGNDSGYGCPQVYPIGLEGLRIAPPLGGLGGGWGMAAGFFLELLVPLRATAPQAGNNEIRFRVNPDIAVVGYPAIGIVVNNDVLFRSPFEDNQLTLDICTISPSASGC